MSINTTMHTDAKAALHAIEHSSLRWSDRQGPEPVEIKLLAINFVEAHVVGATNGQILNAAREFIQNAGSVFAFSEHNIREIGRAQYAVKEAAKEVAKETDLKLLADMLTDIAREHFQPLTARERAYVQINRSCGQIKVLLDRAKACIPSLSRD